MDADQSGFVDQHEMMVALRTNREVITRLEDSKLLSPLLLDPDLGRRFMEMSPKDSEKGMSFNEFVNFMQDNSRDQDVVDDAIGIAEEVRATEAKEAASKGGQGGSEKSASADYRGKTISADADDSQGVSALLRRVFKLIDTNGTSTMGRREFLMSLKAVPDIRDFVRKTSKLEQLFGSRKFTEEFNKLEDPCTSSDFIELGVRVSAELGETASTKRAPMTEEGKAALRSTICEVMGNDSITKSKLSRLLLSTRVTSKLTAASPALADLLKPRTFRKALAELDTDNDKSISPDEVVKFCLAYAL